MSLMTSVSIQEQFDRYFPGLSGEKTVALFEGRLVEALDAPGALTQEKVAAFAAMVNFFCPGNSLKADEIDSPFVQVLYLKAAYDEFSVSREYRSSSVNVIKGSVCGEQRPLGIYKPEGEGATDCIRERLNYLVDKINVPATFILKETKGQGSFQLYFEGVRLGRIRGELSFSRDYARQLALSEIIRFNTDSHAENLLVNDKSIVKFVDGSKSFPAGTTLHNLSSLFQGFFLPHLRGPLTPLERQKIERIDIEASCKQLLAHRLEVEAVKTHRCVLLMLKEAAANGSISLEDLLVITNISHPRGASVKRLLGVSLFYSPLTLFSHIAKARGEGDGRILQRIQEVFRFVLYVKTPDAPPLDNSCFDSLCGRCFRLICFIPEAPRIRGVYEHHVYTYYRNPDKVLFFEPEHITDPEALF